jgi:uridine monophosphate synthetase
MNFFDKLNAAIARNQSLLSVGLDPNPEMMPAQDSGKEDRESLIDDLRDWLQFVIVETADLVCAYKPTLGFYTALGSQGLELL